MTLKEFLGHCKFDENIPMWLDIEDVSEYVSAGCLYHNELKDKIALGKIENLSVRNWSIRHQTRPTLYIEISLPNSSYLR